MRLVINGKAPVTRLKGSPPVTRDFFVYRVDKTTTDDDMKNHLRDLEINYVSVNRLSNVEATYCSYRISVPLDQVDKIMDANAWPTGIRIRQFVVRQNNKDGD